MRKTGFTLIELLIVIGIIALLVSILIPALQNTRDHARSAICLAHLNQWGKTWTLYLDANKETFPAESAINGGWYRGAWIVALKQEWQSKPEMLMCPKANKQHPNGGNIGHGVDYAYAMEDAWSDYWCSYGFNNWLFSDPQDVQGRNPQYYWQKLGNVQFPTEVPLFLDSMWRGGGPHFDRSQAYAAPQYNGQWSGYDREMMHFAIDRHRGFTHCLFVDTSVRRLGLRRLWKFRWHEKFNVGSINTLEQNGSWTWPDWLKYSPE